MPSIILPATLEQLAPMNDFIRAHLTPPEETLALNAELAMEELLVNSANHAYPAEVGQVEVTCWPEVCFDGRNYFKLVLRDWGRPFNPFREAPVPDLELGLDDRPIGGLGVHLVKSLVDHYAYAYVLESNNIELYFERPAHRES